MTYLSFIYLANINHVCHTPGTVTELWFKTMNDEQNRQNPCCNDTYILMGKTKNK